MELSELDDKEFARFLGEHFLPKFQKGTKEHGEGTWDKLGASDIHMHLAKEYMDAAAYLIMIAKKLEYFESRACDEWYAKYSAAMTAEAVGKQKSKSGESQESYSMTLPHSKDFLLSQGVLHVSMQKRNEIKIAEAVRVFVASRPTENEFSKYMDGLIVTSRILYIIVNAKCVLK